MANQQALQTDVSLWKSILTDLHFWVPAIVLVAGLFVLYWIR